MLLDEAANRFHAVRLGVAAERLRPATQAGAISRPLGLFRPEEELHVFAARPACRTRRAAIHAGARNGEDEFSVASGVARQHGIPALIYGCFRRLTRRFGLTDGHWFQAFRCEYGIGCHGKESVRRRLRSGLSESCGQSKIVPKASSQFSTPGESVGRISESGRISFAANRQTGLDSR
jgi:hypothetical protein